MPTSKKGVQKCTHCNGDNHLVDTCFKLHGYPDWCPKGKKVSQMYSNSKVVNDSGPKGNLTTASGLTTTSGMSNFAIKLSYFT